MAFPLAAIPGIIKLGSSLGGLFGGRPEDTSDVGFQRYLSRRNVSRFPTKSQVIQAANGSSWGSADVQAVISTYDESNGTARRGDWQYSITNLTPISFGVFKGANERFDLISNYSVQLPSVDYTTNRLPNDFGGGGIVGDGRTPVSWSEAEVKVGWLPIVLVAVTFFLAKKFLK